jgi:transketolase
MRDHFIQELSGLINEFPNIILITGDLGFGVLDDFRKNYPDHFINAGVAEQNMTGIATGMALEGKIVFTYSIANFPTLRCLEQIRNDACYHGVNVNIVSIGGGFSYGALGISHHATEDLSIMRSLPDISVVSPSTYWETTKSVRAIIEKNGVCYLRLDKSAGRDKANNTIEKFVLGKSRKLIDGAVCTIFVTGGILEEIWDVHKELKEMGYNIRIVSVHTLKPFDTNAVVQAAEETDAIVTVEENTLDGGLGSLIAETLLDNGVFPKKFLRIGLGSEFSSIVGSQKYLRKCYGLDSKTIMSRVLKLIQKK